MPPTKSPQKRGRPRLRRQRRPSSRHPSQKTSSSAAWSTAARGMPPMGGSTVAPLARTPTENAMDRSARPTRTSRIGLRPKTSVQDRRRTATEAEAARRAEAPEDREADPGETGVGRTVSHPVVTRGAKTRGVLTDGEVAAAARRRETRTSVLSEVEPSSHSVSSHRIILDGCSSQERKEPGGSSVGRTTTSLPPGQRNPQEL